MLVVSLLCNLTVVNTTVKRWNSSLLDDIKDMRSGKQRSQLMIAKFGSNVKRNRRRGHFQARKVLLFTPGTMWKAFGSEPVLPAHESLTFGPPGGNSVNRFTTHSTTAGIAAVSLETIPVLVNLTQATQSRTTLYFLQLVGAPMLRTLHLLHPYLTTLQMPRVGCKMRSTLQLLGYPYLTIPRTLIAVCGLPLNLLEIYKYLGRPSVILLFPHPDNRCFCKQTLLPIVSQRIAMPYQ